MLLVFSNGNAFKAQFEHIYDCYPGARNAGFPKVNIGVYRNPGFHEVAFYLLEG